MRAWLGWTLLVAFLLTGCLDAGAPADPGDGSGDGPAAIPADPLRLRLDRCDVVEAFVPVDAARAAPHVPDDFELVVVEGKVPAVLGFVVCGDEGAKGQRAFLAFQVEPKDQGLRAPEGIENYFWEPEHLLAPSEVADAFGVMRANATDAQEVVVRIGPATATAQVDAGDGSHHVETFPGAATAGDLFDRFAPFREYVPAEGGYAYFQGGYAGRGSGATSAVTAMVSTAPDTISRAVLGEEARGVAIIGGQMRFTGVTIGHVARDA